MMGKFQSVSRKYGHSVTVCIILVYPAGAAAFFGFIWISTGVVNISDSAGVNVFSAGTASCHSGRLSRVICCIVSIFLIASSAFGADMVLRAFWMTSRLSEKYLSTFFSF